MSRKATPVCPSLSEVEALRRLVRAPSTQQRIAIRARIILLAAEGAMTKVIASKLGLLPTTVSKWRKRFAEHGLDGIADAPRSGPPRKYTEADELRILARLDEAPPSGHATWTGGLVAKALGNISADQVWRVLRKHSIHLQRRRSWCVSTDPEFARKAADVVGLYLDPPENAIVLAVDEKPHIQALERAQGYLKLPNGRALGGFSHRYKRNGTTTLFAALEIATGLVKAGHYKRRRRVEFLDFMNSVIADYPNREIHIILDNLNTHKPKRDGWLARHKNVHFHFTPTHASWLNQIEIWFSILSRRALAGASFKSVRELREAIDRFIEASNKTAAPFRWTKKTVKQHPLAPSLADLRN